MFLPMVLMWSLIFAKCLILCSHFLKKKSYAAAKLTGETKKSASIEKEMEVGIKLLKIFNLALAELMKSLVYQVKCGGPYFLKV